MSSACNAAQTRSSSISILRESERDVVPHRARDQRDRLRNVGDQAGIAAHELPRGQSADPDRTGEGCTTPRMASARVDLPPPEGPTIGKGSARGQREGDPVQGRVLGARGS